MLLTVSKKPIPMTRQCGLANRHKRNNDDTAGGAAAGLHAGHSPSSDVMIAPQLGQTPPA